MRIFDCTWKATGHFESFIVMNTICSQEKLPAKIFSPVLCICNQQATHFVYK